MCGSRELSTPQPKVSLWWNIFGFLIRVFSGTFLVFLSLVVLVGMLHSPQVQNGLVAIGIVLGLLWWLWSKLPEWLRKLVRRSLKRRERRHEQ